MEYRVELTAEAVQNIDDIHGFIGAGHFPAASAWYIGLRDLISSLSQLPHRGRVTSESKDLRQLLYGIKPYIYRIIYAIDQVSNRVLIVHIRHGARQAFDPDQLI